MELHSEPEKSFARNWAPARAMSDGHLSGYGVISNEAGRCKSSFLIRRIEHISQRRRNFVCFWSCCSSASPSSAQPFTFINWVLPTSHLSITYDHDEFFDLLVRVAGSQSIRHSREILFG